MAGQTSKTIFSCYFASLIRTKSSLVLMDRHRRDKGENMFVSGVLIKHGIVVYPQKLKSDKVIGGR